MAELLTRATRVGWGGLQGGSGDGSRIRDDFTVRPPEARWDRSIRCELRDGDLAPPTWGPTPLEVAQVQAGVHQSAGQSRWISMWMRVDQVAPYTNLDFHFLHEVHTAGSQGSAAWGQNCTTTQLQLRRTPSMGYDHVWPPAARVPIDLGVWHWYAYGFSHTTSATGFAELQYDGTMPYQETGIRTSGDGAAWYPKLGGYRFASTNGTDIVYIAGWALHDSRPAYPGGGGTPPATPTATIFTPATPGSIFVGTLPYRIDIASAPAFSLLYVGLAPSGITAPPPFPRVLASGGTLSVNDTLDLTGSTPGGSPQTLYAALHNTDGVQIGADTIEVVAFPPEAPPPPAGDPIELSFDSVGSDSTTMGLAYADPGGITIDPALVGSRIVPNANNSDTHDAERVLAPYDYLTMPPYEFFIVETGEVVRRRDDGTFTPIQE